MVTLVVGAGVVGLAVARALARRGREVVVVEALDQLGSVTSSRNSEVIHAGIYYPTGSLKALLCVRGRRMLYAYCEEHQVEVRRCGKLIVSTEAAQDEKLEAILRQSRANDLTGSEALVRLSAEEAQAMEPNLRCTAALWSPSTGVLDSHGFMRSLQGDLEAWGGAIALRTKVEELDVKGGLKVRTSGEEPMDLECDVVVNCAGLGSVELARRVRGAPAEHDACIPSLRYAKGNYFALSGCPAPFSRLIYPLPNEVGLGVHLTLDLAGNVKFGPDVEWVEEEDYVVDHRRGDAFYAEVRRYWPGLVDGALLADYAGIRPKTTTGAQDFQVLGPRTHGVPGLLHLFGIESPGLTSSLALAELVADAVE